MKHEFKVTTNGNAAVIACMAMSKAPRLTRVAFGAGLVAEGTDLADVHALVEPVADGAALNVRHTGNQLSFTVQYANINHPEIADFPLSEYLVYIIDPVTGEETDYLYGTLGDYRQPMPQYLAGSGACVFSYPLEVILSGALEVHVDAPAGLLTWLDLGRPGGVASLDETGRIPEEQLPPLLAEVQAQVDSHNLAADAHPDLREAVTQVQAAAQAAAQGPYYRKFEAEEWAGGELRISQSEHGANPTGKACMYQLRQRVERTALDYYGTSAALGRSSMIDAVKAALEANASAPGTCPTAEDGHVMLTWEQVQYYILEGVLAPVEEAMAKAAEKGFDWKDVDITGTPEMVSLDELLKAAYVPALGGSAAQLDSLCTGKALQGLRLRRKADKAGTVERYDLEGCLSKSAWAVMEARVYWDLDTKELVIRYDAPFAGDLFVQGGSGGGHAGGGAGIYVLPAATSTHLGGVKASGSLTVDPDGTAHAVAEISPECFATGEEVDAVLDDVFGAQP